LHHLAIVQWIVHRASTSRMWVRFLLAGPLITLALLSTAEAKKKTAAPSEPARAVLVYNATTNIIADELNIHSIMPIASVTKLMTVFVVLESQANLDEKVIVIPQRLESSRVLKLGMQISRRKLINLALISSDNLAAKLLAVYHPYGYDSFVREMNATAQRLGMKNTSYIEPTGLLLNTSTAWDLHLLNRQLSKHEIFKEAAMSNTTSLEAQNRRGLWQKLAVHNTNTFAGRYDIKIGKTGFTNPAGWCIDMVIAHKDQEINVIVLGSPSKKVRNELVSKKLNNYMSFMTTRSVVIKIEDFDDAGRFGW